MTQTKTNGLNAQPLEASKPVKAGMSYFRPGINRSDNTVPYKADATFGDIVRTMRDPGLQQLTQQLRTIEDEEEQKRFKASRLPFVLFGGEFSKRGASYLVNPSAIVCIDIDHAVADANDKEGLQRLKQLLLHDEWFDTWLLFTSPRGTGVKWVTDVDLSLHSHKEWYAIISDYLYNVYGIVVDRQPSSVASACFLCYDEDLYVNPEIIKFFKL